MRSIWFSDDPEKAWAERYFLAQSPIWMLSVAFVVLSGVLRSWSDLGYLVFSIGVSLPAVVGPLLFARGRQRERGLPYWARFNLWIAVVVFFGTYVGTHYFFDLMGMRYAFPAKWTFEAALVGKSAQHVPVFMYPLTQAYFVTYFSTLVVLHRGLVHKLGGGVLASIALVFLLSYAVAFAETFFMATKYLADLFSYEKHDKMLGVGSFGYATYFVVGLPLVRRIDEGARTRTRDVLLLALATSMGVFFLLEAWARIVGRL
ncbi:MAG TPA: hypothetical protein VL400_18195 [Polyangiaceae bacterium]|nr:hypothetical protein [Polyangiaceae bacterium]